MDTKNIIRIYKETLKQDGSLGAQTRIVYRCKVCGKTCASQMWQFNRYSNPGMCRVCSMRTY